MQAGGIDDHEAEYWTRQIRLGSVIAAVVTLVGAIRAYLDWAPTDRWWALPILGAVVVQAAAAFLPWRRLVRHRRTRQWLFLWWVAELPVMFVFGALDRDGLVFYLPGVILVLVLAAALYSPAAVLFLGAVGLTGFLLLVAAEPRVELVSMVAMVSITLSVVCVNALNARNRRILDDRRRAAERRTEALLENSSDAVVAVDDGGTVHYASPSARTVLGTGREFDAAVLARAVHPEDVVRMQQWLDDLRAAPAGHTARTESRVSHPDGSWTFVDVIGTNRLDDPDLRCVIVSLRDISARRALQEQLSRQAFNDSLTGLPNRTLFRERLDEAAAGRRTTPAAVLLIDLDDFKLVNDNLGHDAGDQLLIAIADRLRPHIRPGDTLARLGGDEFAVLVEDHPGTDVEALADRLLDAVRGSTRLGSRELAVTCSIGIARAADEHGSHAGNLLRNADLAMYAAKRRGGDAHAGFNPAMYAAVLREAQQRDDMERALALQQFVVHYQPVVDLASRRLLGVEALVRWQHPRDGLVYPDRFIHDAEASGLIVPLDRWVLRQACRQLAQWQRLAPADDLKLNVNLSAGQFHHAGLVDDVRQAVADAGIAPASLTLEITESMVMRDVDATIVTLQALRRLGVRLAIDDFGTGYSSLSYLKRLPVDIIKIDRAFIEHVDTDTSDVALVKAVVMLAEALRLRTVAEGIETAEQLHTLRELGCHHGQGYLFGRPVDDTVITDILHRMSPSDEPAATPATVTPATVTPAAARQVVTGARR